MKVFISHSRKDRSWADSIADSLRSMGMVVSSDELIPQGQSWDDVIGQALRESDAVVALLDQTDSSNPNVLFELGAAVALGKQVLPILKDPEGHTNVPYHFAESKFIIETSPEKAARAIAEVVRAA